MRHDIGSTSVSASEGNAVLVGRRGEGWARIAGTELAVDEAVALLEEDGHTGAHADPGSRIMPLRIKGETEVALQALPLTTVMLRPGGIRPAHGERSPHRWMRPFYAVAAPLMGVGARLAPGLLTSTAHLGRAMLALAAMPSPPRVVENDAINRLAAGPGSA